MKIKAKFKPDDLVMVKKCYKRYYNIDPVYDIEANYKNILGILACGTCAFTSMDNFEKLKNNLIVAGMYAHKFCALNTHNIIHENLFKRK